jgi:phosphomannomutase/phosphoglucomutase
LEKGKIECPDEKKPKVLDELLKQVQGLNINTLDGVKIWFDDKSAILVRPSGTEPAYRMYAEAKNAKRAQQLVEEYTAKLERILETI